MDLKTQMKQALQKIDIYYNNCLISHEHLVRKYEDFLCSSFSEKEHNEAIVLHTGSICFEVASLVFAAISNLILNDNSVDDILDSLKDGDRVIYKKKRYIYRGIKEKECDCSIGKKVHLVQEANKTEAEVDVYIQYKDGYKIRPYHGESKTTGGRGVRKSNEERTFFVSSLLGCDLSDVPSVVDSSTVIVISKTKADDILNNTQIKCEEQKINLLDLVTASYYTENNKFPYAGNTEKAEPIIKITSKLDISRKLVKKESSNRVQGLMVFEQESETELTELMERRSLRYVYALYSISSESGSQLVNLYPDAAIFECTKKFLLENVKPIAQSNFYTKKLANQSDIIINKKINRHILNIGFSWEYLKKIKKQIKSVKDTNVASNNKKDSFVIQAYALLNLLLTASFNTIDLQNTIEELKLGVIPPKERIRDLYSYAESFTEEIKGTALDIVESLDLLYDTVFENNLKEKSLKEILSDHINEQIIIVVPKTYYVSVLQRIFRDYFNLAIVNVNNFKMKNCMTGLLLWGI